MVDGPQAVASKPKDCELRDIVMSEPIYVRDLSKDEITGATQAKTGDVLPDGSVILWREDMNRMGLEGVRRWLAEKVLEKQARVSVADEAPIKFRSPDELL
jgi:hypothetical protein